MGSDPSIERALPMVTSLSADRVFHDLAADGAEIMSGTFSPAGARVMLDVDAAYSFLGNARAALLLYVGQPEVPGARLFDSGGKPLPGADWYSVASLSGESAWAQTTHRRLILEVDPGRDVTWQILGAIIGGSATVDVAAPRSITITPGGTKAFVTSPSEGTVTPIVLGRPGYSYDQNRKPMDVAREPVPTDDSPTHLSSDDSHVVVSNRTAAERHVSILSATTHEVLRHVTIPGGSPQGSAITRDGTRAMVGSGTGRVTRIDLASGEVASIQPGDDITGVGTTIDGTSGFAADAGNGNVYRIGLAEMTVDATIPAGDVPQVVRVAPDGGVWVLCRPDPPDVGRLKRIDPASDEVVCDYALPFPSPTDFAIVPVAGQTSEVVRTAWVVFERSRYCEFNIGGTFAGEVHSIHSGSFDEDIDAASGIAVNDFGEIWVAQPDLDRVWKWPGGRLICRGDANGSFPPVFFGEYCQVSVYGARNEG